MEDISKIVLSLDGKIVGYVLDIAIDYETMKVVGYIVVDKETEGEFLIKKQDILANSKDALLIEDVSKLEFVSQKEDSLIGKLVFDDKGNFYGAVESLVFVKERLEKIVTKNCEILTKFVKKVGNDIIFIAMKKRKKAEHIDFPRVNIEDNGSVKIQTQSQVVMPNRVNLSSNFYIGKFADMDLFGYNNERIVSKGEKITKKIVEKAKMHNKINQLFFVIKREK